MKISILSMTFCFADTVSINALSYKFYETSPYTIKYRYGIKELNCNEKTMCMLQKPCACCEGES